MSLTASILRNLPYPPHTQTSEDFFLAEVVDEAVGRFDDSMWAEGAVAYHQYDQAEYSHEEQHLSEVAHLGIRTEGLDKLEAEANKAIEMIKEVDALRQEASEKLQKANEQLADVKELAMGYRQTIKNNFPLEQWEKFGISDKR